MDLDDQLDRIVCAIHDAGTLSIRAYPELLSEAALRVLDERGLIVVSLPDVLCQEFSPNRRKNTASWERILEHEPCARVLLTPSGKARVAEIALGKVPKGNVRANFRPVSKPGRKPKLMPDKTDRAVYQMIDSGDVDRYGRKWKDLLVRYSDQLPKRLSADGLRKRVEREEARRTADKK